MSQNRKAAAKTAAPKAAPAAETPAEAPAEPVVEAAPEPVADEAPEAPAAPEPEPEAEAPAADEPAADEPAEDEAPADVAANLAAELAALDTTEGVAEDGVSLGEVIDQLAANARKALETAAPDPTSAVIEPPAPQSDTDSKPLAIALSVNEAAADRLRVTESKTLLRDARGERLDAEGLFGEQGIDGLHQCNVRIIQHTSATAYNRPVETLYLPAGARVSKEAVETTLAAVAAEGPDEAPAEDA